MNTWHAWHKQAGADTQCLSNMQARARSVTDTTLGDEGRPAKVRVSVRQATRSAAMPGAIMPTSSLPRFLALPCVATRSASLAESPATPTKQKWIEVKDEHRAPTKHNWIEAKDRNHVAETTHSSLLSCESRMSVKAGS